LSSATSGLGRAEIIRYIQELNEEVGPIMAEQLGK